MYFFRRYNASCIRDKLLFNEFLKLKESNKKIKEMVEEQKLSDEEVIKKIEDTDVYHFINGYRTYRFWCNA